MDDTNRVLHFVKDYYDLTEQDIANILPSTSIYTARSWLRNDYTLSYRSMPLAKLELLLIKIEQLQQEKLK